MQHKELRLVLGDQLNLQHPWFHEVHPQVTYFLAEQRSETDYAAHHIQKVVGFFAAMRSFAQTLQTQGHQVIYWPIAHPENRQEFVANIQHLVGQHQFTSVAYQEPDEYRLDVHLKGLHQIPGITVRCEGSHHFITERHELASFFKGKQSYLMESFYRNQRKKTGLLMEGPNPMGGKWNFDGENRKKLPQGAFIPQPLLFQHDVSQIVAALDAAGVRTIGSIKAKAFAWPINRTEALQLLQFFCDELLPWFGSYQDAMDTRGWSLFHSRISFALNTKMLHPLEVCEKVVASGLANPDVALHQIEGFVRQIIGWREYMRGVYWAQMPDYASKNYFNHTRPLPDWYWTGNTKMACMRHAIQQSLEYSYAHHIQRLMVTGNFALLAGIDPAEIDAWYLGIYIDAIEWVEITNTRGMSQFADGGIVGTKPYNSTANYINNMSNYCGGCFYNHKTRTGEKACPFNSLYWDFYERHRNLLQKNPRIGMAYRNLDKMSADEKAAITVQAQQYLLEIDSL
jgi:deoxyribodipyrimidine photolyase-related protein